MGPPRSVCIRQMQKLLILAAAAAALAAPAQASELHVPTAGKTTAQVHADIVTAAQVVCRKDMGSDDLGLTVFRACVKGTVDSAVAATHDRALIAYHNGNPVQLAASR